MLRTVRKNIKSLSITLWLVIASFIATIFLVWGMQSAGPGSSRDATVAATVNGERIPMAEFQRAYQQEVEALRRLYGERWKDEFAQKLDLRHQVLDSLIISRLLLQEAERLGIVISREELAAAVMENPLFAVDGKFSPAHYRRLLDANRLTPERYEEGIRQTLLRRRLTTLIQASAKISEAEAWDFYRTAKEKVRVAYVNLPRSPENESRLENLHTQAGQDGTTWEKTMQESGLKPQRPKPFAFGADVVDPLDNRGFHLAILRLQKGAVSPVVQGGKSIFLIHLVDRDPVTKEAFEKEKDTWMQQLLSEKRLRLWTTWVHELKRRANIEIAQELA